MGQTFQFPDLFPTDKVEQQNSELKHLQVTEDYDILIEKRKIYANKRHNIPNWFGI
jgi:hypothetical protein